ncbi:MAG: HD domain-containing phosphohydrolase [Tissierellales bacterium]
MLVNALYSIVVGLLLINFLLFLRNRKLKTQNSEMNIINESKQAFINADRNMVFLKDENLKYVFTNNKFNEVYNIEPSQIIGRDDVDLNERDAILYMNADLEVINKKIVIVTEMEWENKMQRTTKFPVKLLNGRYGVGAYVEDVTEEYNNKRKLEEMNDMLNKSNNLLLAILESSPDIIVFALDKNYSYLSFNKKHKEIVHKTWGKEIKIGMSNLDIYDSHDISIKAKEKLDRAIEGESFSSVESYGDEEFPGNIWKNYYSPIRSNENEIIGLTCFALNITDRIKAEEEIAYLSYYDSLTGLYNRRFFVEELSRLDVERNLPISIIVGDMNGLKLTNDIFGHASGDLLLQEAAEVFKNVCRADDIIARVGGDEFTILLPNTKPEEAQRIIARIKSEFAKKSVKSIRGSISMGHDTKVHVEEDILRVLENAEDNMYSIKTVEKNDIKSTTIETIIKTLHKDSTAEEKHSINVRRICGELGKLMGISEVDMRRLKDAAYFHDIGKIALDKSLLNKSKTFNEEEMKAIKQHAVLGYRILNSFDETIDLAEVILAHHERWDGSGYPKGLKGEEIPRLARIIAVVGYYDFMINRKEMDKEEAIEEIKKQSGIKFDPEVVDMFFSMITRSN